MVISSNRLSTVEFKKLCVFIYNNFGIRLSEVKKTMLECRLQKRVNALKMSGMKDYCEYLFSKEGQTNELIHMIDVVTTNKTDFFREAKHFEYMINELLPFYANELERPLRIWSAGCSSGEEPYTIGMVINEYDNSIDYTITASDISTEVLAKATTAIYSEERVADIPMSYKRKFLLRSKDSQKRTYRIVPELRKKVVFQRINFIDDNYNVPHTYDIIFCRNVLIYFDKITQESVINKLCTKLNQGGYFFLGHSESVTDMNVPLRQIRPTIFKKI